MSNWPFVKSELISLAQHPALGGGTSWIQDRIAEDPGIPGLGDLVLRERIAGGCDALICQQPGTQNIYALLAKAGKADEVQFVAAIEAWGRMQKLNPRANASVVMIAEQIGTRFLNLISLTSSAVPLAAIEMQALKVGSQMTIIFTPLCGIERAEVEEDAAAAPEIVAEQAIAPEDPLIDINVEPSMPTFEAPARVDRTYWQQRAETGVEMADQLLAAVKAVDPGIDFDYRTEYIGLSRDGEMIDFAQFRPAPGGLLVGLQLEQNPLIEMSIAQAGLEPLPDHGVAGGYTIRISQEDFEAQRNAVTRLMRLAYDQSQTA